MSFCTDLHRALEDELARATGADASAVYVGEGPKQIPRTGLEVWIEPAGGGTPLPGHLRHAFEVHLRLRTLREQSMAGGERAETLLEAAEAIRSVLSGRPLMTLRSVIGVQTSEPTLSSEAERLELLLDLDVIEAPALR